MKVIYADVLWTVNLAMDFMALYLTGRLMRREISPLRLLLASAIGGTYGVCSLFLEEWISLAVAVHLIATLLICLVAYGRPLLGVTAAFYATGFLLGGAMSVLWEALNRLGGEGGEAALPTASGPAPWMLLLLALLCALGALFVGGIGRRREMVREAELRVGWREARWRGTALVDNACFLTEPISGKGVILLPRKVGGRLFPPELCEAMAEHRDAACRLTALDGEYLARARLVPMMSAGGGGLILTLRPDLCEINGRRVTVYIGLGDFPQAIIPADLVKGEA